MIKYVKCPRCELNYIDSEKQEYCDVCIAEMKGNKLQFADLDDEELEEVLEEEASDLCPVCGVNHVRFGETMCDACKAKGEIEEEAEVDPEQDEEWKNYLEETEDLSLEDAQLDEELKEELEEEAEEEEDEEESENEDDFFDDDLESLDDYDDDDDDLF